MSTSVRAIQHAPTRPKVVQNGPEAMPAPYPDGSVLCSMNEALASARISRSTYIRWVKVGKVRDTARRDRNGWRLFSEAELTELKAVAFSLSREPHIVKFDAR